MNELSKLLCTHCLNSFIYFTFCMIICISLSLIYNLKIKSINQPEYLITYKSCDFLISKRALICICQVTTLHWNGKYDSTQNVIVYALLQLFNELCILYDNLYNFVMKLLLKRDSVNCKNYLPTFKSCNFLISKGNWICNITN